MLGVFCSAVIATKYDLSDMMVDVIFSSDIVCYVFRYLTGQVDKRTLEKYEREAKEKNRESW